MVVKKRKSRRTEQQRPMWRELSEKETDEEAARGLARRTNVATLNSVSRSLDRIQRVLVMAIRIALYEIDGKETGE